MGILGQAIGHFHGALHLLFIEDEQEWVDIVKDWLNSPLWNITVAASWKDLRALPLATQAHWSCIIADIELHDPDGKTGIDVLRQFTHFPIKITLSGMKSMEAAYQATRLGGSREVFDKSGPDTLRRLPVTVAKFAALGYMLRSHCPDHVDTLFALIDQAPSSVTDWAEKACITRRRLEQICDTFLDCPPKEAIQLHRTLTYVQLSGAARPSNFKDILDACEPSDEMIKSLMSRYPREHILPKSGSKALLAAPRTEFPTIIG